MKSDSFFSKEMFALKYNHTKDKNFTSTFSSVRCDVMWCDASFSSVALSVLYLPYSLPLPTLQYFAYLYEFLVCVVLIFSQCCPLHSFKVKLLFFANTTYIWTIVWGRKLNTCSMFMFFRFFFFFAFFLVALCKYMRFFRFICFGVWFFAIMNRTGSAKQTNADIVAFTIRCARHRFDVW